MTGSGSTTGMGLVCGGNDDNVGFMLELVTVAVAVGAVAAETAKGL
jgi:hypothetical protein